MSHTDVGSAVVEVGVAEVFEALVDERAPGGGYRLVLSYDDPAIAGKSEGNSDIVEVRFTEVRSA